MKTVRPVNDEFWELNEVGVRGGSSWYHLISFIKAVIHGCILSDREEDAVMHIDMFLFFVGVIHGLKFAFNYFLCSLYGYFLERIVWFFKRGKFPYFTFCFINFFKLFWPSLNFKKHLIPIVWGGCYFIHLFERTLSSYVPLMFVLVTLKPLTFFRPLNAFKDRVFSMSYLIDKASFIVIYQLGISDGEAFTWVA